MMAMPPATPGKTSPGLASSKTSPKKPRVMRSEATVGSERKSRNFSQAVISVVVRGAETRPWRVTVLPGRSVRSSLRAWRRRSSRLVRDVVDDVQLDGLGLADGDRLAHGRLGPVGVAAAKFGDAADEGDGVVLNLVAEVAADVAAIGVDGGGGADRVFGAIAAMFAAIVMNVPALAARDPGG